eukprot:gnl/Dysnectes_brevis/1093_a1223_4049.p1 GENE.gnl/Dysnectes_brevis/1093_a1223_4049~~gnl/Dysnectes_brevis/1093_a1223_4049.p1  ORF type:complete len:180 (-),score=10.21 gnl/Dysnectes_brevis/1093_a1223_4049:47-586(-)
MILALFVILYSTGTAVLSTVINWFFVYKKDSYKDLKKDIDRKRARLEQIKEAGFESKKIQDEKTSIESMLQKKSAELFKMRLLTTSTTSISMLVLSKVFGSFMKGKVVAHLPFVPPSILLKLTQRGLKTSDPTAMSSTPIFLLCSLSIKAAINRALGFAPPKMFTPNWSEMQEKSQAKM